MFYRGYGFDKACVLLKSSVRCGLKKHIVHKLGMGLLLAGTGVLGISSNAWASCAGPNGSGNVSTYECSGTSTFTNSGSNTSAYTGNINSQYLYNDSTGVTTLTNTGTLENNNVNVDSNHLNFVVTNDGMLDIHNSGTIHSDNGSIYSGVGVHNTATIGFFDNSGLISATRSSIFNESGVINDLELSSSSVLTGTGYGGIIGNFGSIGTLNNAGSILVDPTTPYSLGGINNNGTITALNNTGTISGATSTAMLASGITNTGAIDTLTNSGTINGDGFDADYNVHGGGGAILNFDYSSGTIHTLTNSGTINGGVINVGGTINTINNMGGTINATSSLAAIYNGSNGNFTYSNASIGTITNSGTIAGGTHYGIMKTTRTMAPRALPPLVASLTGARLLAPRAFLTAARTRH